MRSPLTETIFKVQGMITHVRENLSTDEFMLFLDLLVPQPEVVKTPTKKKRKSSGKSQRASNMATTLGKNRQSQEPRCVACYEVLEHANHGTDKGQHQFETSLAARVNPILDKYNAKCVFELDGKVCHGAQDDSIHDKSLGYLNHHEFQPEQAQAVGGD